MEIRKKQLSKSMRARISADPMSVADLYSLPDDHDICEPLVRALQDPDMIVRQAAIDDLICLNDMYASNSILWMLLHGNAYAREAAARVLAVIGKGDLLATKYLAIALHDPDNFVRDAAADALISVNLKGNENF